MVLQFDPGCCGGDSGDVGTRFHQSESVLNHFTSPATEHWRGAALNPSWINMDPILDPVRLVRSAGRTLPWAVIVCAFFSSADKCVSAIENTCFSKKLHVPPSPWMLLSSMLQSIVGY